MSSRLLHSCTRFLASAWVVWDISFINWKLARILSVNPVIWHSSGIKTIFYPVFWFTEMITGWFMSRIAAWYLLLKYS